MTYEEALSILRNFLHFLVPSARANGKTMIAYKRLEAFCKAFEALEMRMPKKPIEKYVDYDDTEAGLCPFCNEGVNEEMNFCSYCGQALDWEVNE